MDGDNCLFYSRGMQDLIDHPIWDDPLVQQTKDLLLTPYEWLKDADLFRALISYGYNDPQTVCAFLLYVEVDDENMNATKSLFPEAAQKIIERFAAADPTSDNLFAGLLTRDCTSAFRVVLIDMLRDVAADQELQNTDPEAREAAAAQHLVPLIHAGIEMIEHNILTDVYMNQCVMITHYQLVKDYVDGLDKVNACIRKPETQEKIRVLADRLEDLSNAFLRQVADKFLGPPSGQAPSP